MDDLQESVRLVNSQQCSASQVWTWQYEYTLSSMGYPYFWKPPDGQAHIHPHFQQKTKYQTCHRCPKSKEHGRVGPQIGPEVLKGAFVLLNHPLLIIYLTLRLWKPWPIEIDHKNHNLPFFKMVIFQFNTAQNHMGPTRSSPVFSHKCLHSAKPEHPRDDHSFVSMHCGSEHPKYFAWIQIYAIYIIYTGWWFQPS